MGAYSETINPLVATEGQGAFFLPEVWDLETRRKMLPLQAFRQFSKNIRTLDGGGVGDTVHVIKREDINTAGTTLTANTTVPRHSFTEGTITYSPAEWGNAISPEARWLKLSPYGLRNELTDVLARDAADSIDCEVRRLLVSGLTAGTNCFTMGAGGTLVGTTKVVGAAGTAGTPVYRMTGYGVWAAVDYLASQNAPMIQRPGIPAGYVGILHPHQARGIKRDNGFQDVSMYAKATNIFNNEIGKWEGVYWIETTNGYLDSVCTAAYCALVLGENAFGEDFIQDVTIKRDPDTDFGRQLHFAWLADFDFQVEWANRIAGIFSLTGSP